MNWDCNFDFYEEINKKPVKRGIAVNDLRNSHKLFIASDGLKNRIKAVSDRIDEQTGHQVVFEEFIAIPQYGGNIILRYNVLSKNYTLEDLDDYEEVMNRVVGNEFLINFMGSVYRHVGIDYTNIEEKFLSLKEKYQHTAIPQAAFAEAVQADAKYILHLCDLPEDSEVWEIQVEDPMRLLILGEENRLIKTTEGIEVIETRKDVCEGLMKAAVYAKDHRISFGRVLAK